jgi:hypothetical protein
VEFCIQEPQTGLLLERLAASANGAAEGAAVFAFASTAGVNALFSRDEIRTLAQDGALHVIVGVDAITSVKAMERIK